MVALSASRLVWPATSWISLTTSPIFCAALASEPIWSLVEPASLVAMPTRLFVWPSWRLISSIDADISFAAEAAVSTLADASFEACTAPSARCDVLCEAANKVAAVDRIAPRVVADGFQHVLRALTETGDCGVDGAAALFFRGERITLLIHAPALGNVLVRRNPSAVRHRPVGDVIDAPVLHFDHAVGDFAFTHLAHDRVEIAVDVARERADFDAMREQLAQRAAGLRDFGRKIVHLPVLIVDDDQPAGCVEHAEALRHVVDRGDHLLISPREAREQKQRNQAARREPEHPARDGCRQRRGCRPCPGDDLLRS